MKERSIATSIILSIVTCGIYGIYWLIVLNDEVKTVSKDNTLPTGGVVFLLTIVTCGIYGIYWAYKIGQLTAKAQADKKMPVKDNSMIYLILSIFGLSIVVYALVQNDLNEMIKKGA